MQQSKITSSSPRQLIARSLQPWRFRVLTAYGAALILGLVSALLGLVIGPAMQQVLLSFDERAIPWVDIIGPVWSAILRPVLPGDQVMLSELFLILPSSLMIIATLKALLTFWQWMTWEQLGEKLAFAWRRDLVDGFVAVSPSQRDDGAIERTESSLGGLMSQDIRTCRDYVVHYFGGLPREGFQVLFMAFSLAALNLKLFLIFLFCIAPVGALLSRLGKKLRRRASHALEDNSVLGEWIQQRLLGVETIKQYQTESLELGEMKKASQNLFEVFLRAARLKARTSPMIELLGVFAMSLALLIAFGDIAAGSLSGAVGMSFFTTLAFFAQSMAKLGRYFNSNREGLAAAERIFTAISAMDKHNQNVIGGGVFSETVGPSSAKLSHVSVRYGEKQAVTDFSFQFEAAKVYCLVGASGAGKSSIFNAMLGLRPRSGGVIEYCIGSGFDDRTLDIAYLPQQIPMIPASIGENVSYPHENFDPARVHRAFDKVHFKLDPERLLHGLETLVGPGGLQLSGGQLQRLQLARLVYHHAPFVLVDEGTSALDPEMEQTVLSFLRGLARSGAIVIMIAHRKAAVEVSDEIIVLANGRMVAHGSPLDVMQSEHFTEIFK